MSQIEKNILTLQNATTSGSGTLVDSIGASGSEKSPAVKEIGDCRFFLRVTSLTGTAPTIDIDIVATVNGGDHILGSFTQASGTTTESIEITNCPANVKAVYAMGGTVTDCDATVDCVRTYSR